MQTTHSPGREAVDAEGTLPACDVSLLTAASFRISRTLRADEPPTTASWVAGAAAMGAAVAAGAAVGGGVSRPVESLHSHHHNHHHHHHHHHHDNRNDVQ